MNKFLLGSAAAVWAFCSVAAPVKFADDIASWKNRSMGTEKAGSNLRVSVVANASGNYGQIWKYIPAIPAGTYLQVNVAGMENSGAFGWVHSPSNTVKRKFGVLFEGINTYSPNTKTQFALAICQTGGGKKEGSWINYATYTVDKAPENSLIAVKEPAVGALKVGDTLNFKIFRNEPCANPVKVRLFANPENKRNLQNYRVSKDSMVDAVYDAAADAITVTEGSGVGPYPQTYERK